MSKLFIVFLGGKLAHGRLGEDHEVVAVVAENKEEARLQAKLKWNGLNQDGVHVDAVEELIEVDEYEIVLQRKTGNGTGKRNIDDQYTPFVSEK
jgi:hypothetical protein